jgi:hypothetical protein
VLKIWMEEEAAGLPLRAAIDARCRRVEAGTVGDLRRVQLIPAGHVAPFQVDRRGIRSDASEAGSDRKRAIGA